MAARRRTRKVTRRRPRTVNLLNTGVDIIQANAINTMLTGNGLWAFWVKPWTMNTGDWYTHNDPSTSGDRTLDSRELIEFMRGRIGGGTGGPLSGASATWFSQLPGKAGLGEVIMDHVQRGALPAIGTIAGAQILKRFLRSKWGLTRPANKLLKAAGIKAVRF
jgi:hypothetical protein